MEIFVDRKTFKLPFTKLAQPDWHCPTCQKGLLRIVDETFFEKERSYSEKAHGHDDWDPDWVSSVYSCLLECSNDSCKEAVSSTGNGFIDWDIEDDVNGFQSQVYSSFYTPLFFNPHLQLIPIPQNTPDTVKTKLNNSFQLFFSSPSAASNNIRAAIESMLDSFSVNRYRVSNGKRHLINLHQRIGLLPVKYDEFKDLLMAAKWLGNAGSHSGKELTSDDVMDAYEIIEYILSEIYDGKSKKIKTLANKVNKSKGPSS